jgi:hypothetical protein
VQEHPDDDNGTDHNKQKNHHVASLVSVRFGSKADI